MRTRPVLISLAALAVALAPAVFAQVPQAAPARAADSDPAHWDWPGVAANPDLQKRIIEGGYTPSELHNIRIVLETLPGPRRPAPAGSTPPPPPPPPPPPSPPAPGERTIASTGMRMPPAMAANFVANPISHGRGFRGLELPYGGNGYTSNGITNRTNLVDDIIASGNLVFVTWLIEGRHTNLMFGFPGTGAPVKVRESALFRFENGKVAESDFRGDDLALYTQLGGKLRFPAAGAKAATGAAPTAPRPQPSDKAALIIAAAEKAAKTDPKGWDWPPAASDPAVRASILAAGNTAEERRNLFAVLAMQSGRRWPVNGATSAPPPAPAARPASSSAEAARIATTGNLLGAPSLFAPGGISHGRGFRGLEKFYGANGYHNDSLSDRINAVDTIIAKGDRVWVSWIIEGRHTGELFGFPGTGKPIKVRESAMIRFKDGRIVESDYLGDDLALYLQAGGTLEFPDGGFKNTSGSGEQIR